MHIELVLLDRVVNLVEEGLDVGVRIGPLQDSTVIARGVRRVRHIVVASPALLRRLGTPRASPRAGEAAVFCASAPRRAAPGGSARREGATVGVPQGPLDCNLAAPLLEACAAGLGFVRCLSYQASSLLADKQLRIVLRRLRSRVLARQPDLPQRARCLPFRTKLFIESMADEPSHRCSSPETDQSLQRANRDRMSARPSVSGGTGSWRDTEIRAATVERHVDAKRNSPAGPEPACFVLESSWMRQLPEMAVRSCDGPAITITRALPSVRVPDLNHTECPTWV